MIETEIKVRYDSLVKAQEEADRLTSELKRMMEAGGSSVEEMQRLQDELTEVRKSISDNADELTRWADISAGDLSEAIEKAEFAVIQLNDTVKANKEIIAGLQEEYDSAKDGLEELAAKQLELNEAMFSDENEIKDLEEYLSTLDEGSIAYRNTSERLAELRAEVQTLQPVLEKIDGEIKSKTDRMAQAQSALAKEKASLAENTKAQTQMQMTLDQTKRKYEEMTARITANNEKMKESTASFQSIALKMFSSAGLGAGLGAFIGQMQATRAQMQDMENAMSTMLGADKAKGIMGDLKQLATQSPLAMTDMVGAEKMMVSFGLDAKKSVEYIKALSDISGGDSGKFNSLALAFSQMSASGKLMGQDLMQMVNQGFNPLEEMSRKTGKTIKELKDEMSKGAISAQMVQDAFMSATQEGGKFFGMSESGSQTINGQLSMLGDAWDNLYNSIGQKAESVLGGVIGFATTLVNNWQKLIPILVGVGAAYGVVKLAEIGAIEAEKELTAAKLKLTGVTITSTAAEGANTAGTLLSNAAKGIATKIQLAYNAALSACPYIAVALGISALGYWIYDTFIKETELERAQSEVNQAFVDAEIQTKKDTAALMHHVRTIETASSALEEKNAAKEEDNTRTAEGNALTAELSAETDKATGATESNTSATEDNTGAVIDEKKALEDMNTAKGEIIALASRYGIELTSEQLKVENLADTYKTLADEIERTNKAKALNNLKEGAEKEIATARSEMFQNVNERFQTSIYDNEKIKNDEELQSRMIGVQVAGATAMNNILDEIEKGELEFTDKQLKSTSNFLEALAEKVGNDNKDYQALQGYFSALKIFNWRESKFDTSFDYFADAVDILQGQAFKVRYADQMAGEDAAKKAEELKRQAEGAPQKETAKHSLTEITRRIVEAQSEIKKLRAKMAEGEFTDDDIKKLEEQQKAEDAAKKEYKQATGKDYGAQTKDSAKKLKEAELNLEKELYNLRKQEQNMEKSALQYQMGKTESLSEQKKLQDQILAIEREQAIEDLKRQEAEKLRQIKERKDLNSKDKEKLTKATKELYEGKEGADGAEGVGLIGMKQKEFEQKEEQQNLDYLKKQEEQTRGLLDTYGDYYDKRMAIEEKYAKERAKLADSGLSESSVEMRNLSMAQKDELAGLGKSYTYGDDEWRKSMEVEKEINAIADKAVADGTDAMLQAVADYISELDLEIADLDARIAEAKKSGNDSEAVKLDKQRLGLQKQVNKAKEVERGIQQDVAQHNGKSGKELERQNKRYEKTKKVIGLVKTAFEELGDVMGEDTKKYMEMVTVIADSTLSVINSIQGYTEVVNKGIEGSAKTSAESVKAVEKASVILAVIGAVIQVATKIMQVFSKGNQTAEEVSRLREMASIYSEIAGAQAEIASNARTAEQAKEATDAQTEALEKQAQAEKDAIRARAKNRSSNAHSTGYRLNEQLQGSDWQSAFSAAGVSVKNWEELMNLAPEKLREIRENNAYLWTGLDSDIRQSLESLISIDEQGKQAADDLQDRFANITLDSLKDSANEVFKDVSAQADEFSESVKGAIADSVINQAVEEQFGDRIKAYQEKLADYGKGGYSPEEARELMEEGRQIERDMNEAKARKAEEYGESGLFASQDDNTQTTGTFAEMSEATANALEGRFTAVYESNLRIESAVTANGGIIGTLAEINTSIAEQIAQGARAEAEAQTETQRILAESLLELRDIRANGTGILQIVRSMASDLAEVKNSTAKL